MAEGTGMVMTTGVFEALGIARKAGAGKQGW